MELAFLAVAGLLAAVGAYVQHQRRQRERRDLGRLVERDPRLRICGLPFGRHPRDLAMRVSCLPLGDRRNGLEHGVEGPLPVRMDGRETELESVAFRWWWEVRQRTRSRGRTRTTYTRDDVGVVAVRLPTVVPAPISITGESLLGRLGLTRGGRQLESSEFNRRFRVEGRDDHLTLMLLDADMQRLLVEAFPGRGVELADDVLVMTGSPTHRDTSLTGFVGELPAIRQDLQRLLATVPEQFWRAVGGPAAPPGAGDERRAGEQGRSGTTMPDPSAGASYGASHLEGDRGSTWGWISGRGPHG